MTPQEARQYLPDGDKLSDQEVEQILAEDYALANIAVGTVLKNNIGANKQGSDATNILPR